MRLLFILPPHHSSRKLSKKPQKGQSSWSRSRLVTTFPFLESQPLIQLDTSPKSTMNVILLNVTCTNSAPCSNKKFVHAVKSLSLLHLHHGRVQYDEKGIRWNWVTRWSITVCWTFSKTIQRTKPNCLMQHWNNVNSSKSFKFDLEVALASKLQNQNAIIVDKMPKTVNMKR